MTNHHQNEVGESHGFSLIELILVIAILSVLVSIAIPVLNGIEDRARSNALQTVAQGAALGATADLSQSVELGVPYVEQGFTAEWKGGAIPTQVDEVCVIATRADTGEVAEAGPGC